MENCATNNVNSKAITADIQQSINQSDRLVLAVARQKYAMSAPELLGDNKKMVLQACVFFLRCLLAASWKCLNTLQIKKN